MKKESIDPLKKREDFAVSLRKSKKASLIKDKRDRLHLNNPISQMLPVELEGVTVHQEIYDIIQGKILPPNTED